MTEERALPILNSRKLVDQSGVMYKGIKVTSVTKESNDGTPFTYPSGDRYAIVNLNAFTPYHQEKVWEDLESNDFQSACNRNLSTNVPIDEADNYQKGMFVDIQTNSYEPKDEPGVTAIGVAGIFRPVAVEAKSVSFVNKTADTPTT